MGRGEGEGHWHLRFNKGSLRPEMEISTVNIQELTHLNGEEFWKANQSG